MKKSKLLILCVFVLAVVIACGPAPDSATPVPDRTDAEGEGDIFPRPTITPDPQGEDAESLPDPGGYPAPLEEVTQPESAYPAGGQIAQPESAYPAGGSPIWIVFPVGIQCEEGGVYGDLDEAVETLDGAGVIVVDQGTIELIVATACGQPTSEHYRAQILSDGLERAQSLGWEVYQN